MFIENEANPFGDETPHGQVRAWLHEQTEPVHCPTCTQWVSVYDRKITGPSARLLILIYKRHGLEWVHVEEFCLRWGEKRGDFTKLAHWGLIENARGRREDGGRRGIWRITARGLDWIMRRTTVQEEAFLFDNQVVKMVGKDVTVDMALAKRGFNWDELMEDATGFGGV